MDRSNGHSPAVEAELTSQGVTEHLSRKVFSFDGRFSIAVAGLAILVILGIIGFVVRVNNDGLSDSTRGAWGYYAAMFGFLLVTAGSAPVVAVAFRWTKSHWRRPLSRASEMFALVGLLNILWFIPLMMLLPDINLADTVTAANPEGITSFEVGIDRRTIWFEVPIGAPLWWDTLALVFLVLCGLAILWVSARPDMAAVAQRGTGWRAGLLSRLSMGWRGSEREWKLQGASLAVLGAFYFMLLVLVHTLISLDFALSLVPGWKDSIFAPYHVLTGIQAAGGTILVTMFLMRTLGGYRDYLGLDPFWCFSKVLLGVTLLWGYFWFSEFMTFWYGRDPTEQSVIKLIMFESYRTAFLFNLFFSFIIPLAMLIWNGVRKSVIGPTIAGASVVIGAFFMMVRIYVPAFNIPQEDIGAHTIAEFEELSGPVAAQLLPVLPDVWDVFMIMGGLGGVALIFLLGTKLLPVMSMWETKEGLLYVLRRPFMKGHYMVLGKPE